MTQLKSSETETINLVRQADVFLKENKENIDIEQECLQNNPASLANRRGPEDQTYQKVYDLLKGHTITNSVRDSTNAVRFDGTREQAMRLASLPSCELKTGIFVSLQKTRCISWKGEDADELRFFVIEFDGITKTAQLDTINDSGLVPSFQVDSGNKSIHTFIALDRAVDATTYDHIAERLMLVFPQADRSVLKTKNKLVRFPIVGGKYKQPLLSFNGIVSVETLMKWLDEKITALESVDLDKTVRRGAYESTQNKIETYLTERNINLLNHARTACPVCSKQNKDPNARNLCLRRTEEGRIIYFCHRCNNDPFLREQLNQNFLESDYKKNPNALTDMMQFEIQGRYYNHATNLAWYETTNHPLTLCRIEEEKLKNNLWPIYERHCRKLGKQYSKCNFSELINTLAEKNKFEPFAMATHLIALQDGMILNTGDLSIEGELKSPTDFYLPLNRVDFEKPKQTPEFDRFIAEHASAEDRQLLLEALGFVFSGAPVSQQQWLLVISGPTNTGKSQLLEFLLFVLGNHAERLSITDCLQSAVIAARILGKRLCVSSEVSVSARDGQRFRGIVSGEELRVRLLYRGEYVTSHNATFVCATNDSAWLENVPENEKRLRVVRWINPIPKSEQDPEFLSRLKGEAVGIIVKCLKAYTSRKERIIPSSESTRLYMNEAGRNANSVAAFLEDEEITGGDIFTSSTRFFKYYVQKTTSRMDLAEFSRKAAKALGTPYHSRKCIDGTQTRGFLLNRELKLGGFAQ